MNQTSQMDALFARPLRGEEAPWPNGWHDAAIIEDAQRRLYFHGIAGLLTARKGLLLGWPGALLQALHDEALVRAMWELRHGPLLAELLKELGRQGLRSALLKGTALAYALYDDPATRIRGDTDLLIHSRDLAAMRIVLSKLGWRRVGGAPGRFGPMQDQECWRYCDAAGLKHDIDLHWEVTPLRALNAVFYVDTVLDEAVPLPQLSAHARSAAPVTRLMHGCINRALHRRSGYYSLDRNEYDPGRLIWAYDFHLEAGALTEAQWDKMVEASTRRGVAAVSGEALSFAQNMLGTKVPEIVMQSLQMAEPSTPAMTAIANAGGLRSGLADLRATTGLKDKVIYLLARAFPSGDHLRAKYPQLRGWPLPALHFRRHASALGRLIGRGNG